MSAYKEGDTAPTRLWAGRARGESGALMMFVLMAILLVGAITVSAMQIIGADVLSGAKEVEADQVYNIAQAGIHYAIGQLEGAGAHTYAGETKTITSGTTTLGTVTITVNCIDTGGSPNPSGCGATDQYRRIISKGKLPVSGPSRTIVAIVQGTSSGGGGGPTYVVCNSTTINTDPGLLVYGDWGTNQNFDFAVPYGDSTDQLKPCSAWAGGKCPGNGTNTGKIVSSGTVTCDGSCAAQFPGGVTNGKSPAPCGTVTLGTFTPGGSNLSPAGNYTMNSVTGYSWNNVTIGSGTLSGSTCTSYRDLTIVAPASGTQVVQMNSLYMGTCSRLIISDGAGHAPVGSIDLRIASTASGEGGTLNVQPYVHFGVLPSDTAATPAPVSAGNLTVESQAVAPTGGNANTRSNANLIFCADIGSGASSNACVVSGYFEVPNALFFMEYGTTFYGALASSQFTSEQGGTIVFDASAGGGGGGGGSYNNFKTLMSWKDQ